MSDEFNGGFAGSLSEVRRTAAGFSEELAEANRAMREMDVEARRLSRSLGSSLRTAFDRAIFGGRGLGDVLRGLAESVVSRTLNAALKPVTTGLGTAMSSAFGAIGFERGAAFSAGKVRAFARGGVVDGPTHFPMAGGMGLMGEAGPEAIMPLGRGPDGRLGVRTLGGGSGPTVVVNISTPDVDGFQRSRGQVAAQLARAVARGNRQL